MRMTYNWRDRCAPEVVMRHLNYPEVVANEQGFGAKRVILTHMSREMLVHTADVPQECAEDGTVIEP